MSDSGSITRPRWPDRPFHFVHPEWMLADFAERLSGTASRLEELLVDLDPEIARNQLDGTWSIQQNAGHLADLEELWQQRLRDLEAGRSTYRPVDAAHYGRRAERHQERSMAEVLAEFRSVRQHFVDQLRSASPDLQRASAYHERLASLMRLVDMAQFAAEHDDHHLLRIRELIDRIGHPVARP